MTKEQKKKETREKLQCQKLWAEEKYRVLRYSQKIYREIREYLKEDEPRLHVLEEIIARAYEEKPERGAILNAMTHVWGHYKKRATAEEKETYLELVKQFEQGFIPEKTVWNYLHELLGRYPDLYLEQSTIWEEF